MIQHSHGFMNAREAERLAEGTRRRTFADARAIERVVTAATAGDTTALSSLIDRFGARIRAVARRHRLAVHDVEDVMQTTWLRLLEHGDSIRDPLAVGAWLETTARRECLRVLTSTTRERPTGEMLLEEPAPPVDEQELVAAERRAALASALEKLPRKQRRLLSMLLLEPAPSYVDISRALDMPIGSIGPTRARSLARLRENQALTETIEPW
jgi:RNA polymerase sigma factor (sigma-70 family)